MRFLSFAYCARTSLLSVRGTSQNSLRCLSRGFRTTNSHSRWLEIRDIESHLLCDRVYKNVYATIDCFVDTPLRQRSLHAIAHLAQKTFGQCELRGPTELSERRLRRNRHNQQQSLGAAGLHSDIPVACELL